MSTGRENARARMAKHDAAAATDTTPAVATTTSSGRRVTTTRASAITMRPVQWLWQDRMALGSFGLVGGREGYGKTMVEAEITAAVTTGRLEGACFGIPHDVVIVAPEDSREHTLVPRLVAAGADLDRVHFVTVTEGEAESDLVLPQDASQLERVIRDVSAVLVWFDPLLSRLDAHLDSHKDAEARRALEPLAKMAESTGACFVGIIHVNKSTTSDPLTMLMASRAFAAVARWVLFVMMDPEDEHRRLLGLAKSNLGRTNVPTLAFQVVSQRVATTPEGDIWTGRLVWQGEAPGSIREALQNVMSIGDRSLTTEAADWLLDFLTEAGGSATRVEIIKAGVKAGHTADHLRRARERLKLPTANVGFPRTTTWTLSSQSGQSGSSSPTSPPTATTATTGNTSITLTHLEERGPVAAVAAVVEAPRRADLTGDDDDGNEQY